MRRLSAKRHATADLSVKHYQDWCCRKTAGHRADSVSPPSGGGDRRVVSPARARALLRRVLNDEACGEACGAGPRGPQDAAVTLGDGGGRGLDVS